MQGKGDRFLTVGAPWRIIAGGEFELQSSIKRIKRKAWNNRPSAGGRLLMEEILL